MPSRVCILSGGVVIALLGLTGESTEVADPRVSACDGIGWGISLLIQLILEQAQLQMRMNLLVHCDEMQRRPSCAASVSLDGS